MRGLSVALALCLVGGCNSRDSADVDRGSERIECATDGSDRFEAVCTVERTVTEAGPVLTIRAPDGSFRRLLVTTDGRGVAAADGGEPAIVNPVGADRIEVRIGRDRYRLAATLQRPAP